MPCKLKVNQLMTATKDMTTILQHFKMEYDSSTVLKREKLEPVVCAVRRMVNLVEDMSKTEITIKG